MLREQTLTYGLVEQRRVVATADKPKPWPKPTPALSLARVYMSETSPAKPDALKSSLAASMSASSSESEAASLTGDVAGSEGEARKRTSSLNVCWTIGFVMISGFRG